MQKESDLTDAFNPHWLIKKVWEGETDEKGHSGRGEANISPAADIRQLPRRKGF